MANASQNESVFYDDAGIFIGSARVVVYGKTYATRHVTSVTMIKTGRNFHYSYTLVTYPGMMILLIGLGISSWLVISVGVGMVVGGSYIASKTQKDEYTVVLRLSAGEQSRLTTNEATASKIVEAINRALVET